MVPEYLTPNNGGLLSPGQLMGLSHAVFLRHGGPEVAELVLEITPDVMVGKVRMVGVRPVPFTASLQQLCACSRQSQASVFMP